MDRRDFLSAAAVSGLSLHASPGAPFRGFPEEGSPLRVALIGKDGHTNVVLDGMLGVPGARLVALAKGRPEDGIAGIQKHKAFLPDTRIYEDYRRLLDQEKPHLVGICLPYAENAAAAREAAERGIHVLTEKPAATTLAELDHLEAALKKSGTGFSMMLTLRSSPRFQAARQAVRQGWVGEPILISSQKSYKFGRERPWFYKDARIYGGTIPWVGIHAIDFMRYVSGCEFTQVMTLQGNKAHPQWPGCEDFAGLLFRLQNGGTAVCHMDFLRPDSAPTHGDDRLRIAGSEGVLEVLESQEQITLFSSAGRQLPKEMPQAPDLLASFVAFLRGKGAPLVGAEDALRITRICLLARDAAGKGSWVNL